MSKHLVYESYEVRDGFGPYELGALVLQTTDRHDADDMLETLWALGSSGQLFGIRIEDGTRVLLRSLVAHRAA